MNGETVAHEIVAHVDHIRLGKEDDAVAVGVAAGEMKRADIFPIEMHGHVVIESKDGEGFLRLWFVLELQRAQVSPGSAVLHALAHIVLRDDGRIFLEESIPAGVVAVVVRVDDEPDRLVGHAFQGRADLVGQRCVLIVNNHDPVFADRRADVARVRTLQHVDAVRDLYDLDFNLAVVFLRPGHDGQCNRERPHDF